MVSPAAPKTVLVTGATDGVGRALCFLLAAQGHTVLAHGRDPARLEALVEELRLKGSPEAEGYLADFAALGQVRAMAGSLAVRQSRLDVLVNNAGLLAAERQLSADGHELVLQVNYLVPYLLSRLLLPLLEAAAPARIVNVASLGQAPLDFDDLMLERDWESRRAYSQSKLAMIMMTVELAPVLARRGVSVNALHPATFMPTKMVEGRFTPVHSVEEGTRNVLRLAVDPALDGVTGRFFNMGEEGRANDQAYDGAARRRLIEASDRLLGLPPLA